MQGKDYLVVVDYHTNYPEISLLPDTTSSTVIKHTKSIFARHGIPKVVISDNGPQYACKEYREFSSNWEFQHITASPYHPEANGKAEPAVQTIKSLMKKALRNEEDPYLALMNFRACPSPDGTPAPAVMLMNRRLRTRLPRLSRTKQETLPLTKLVLDKQLKQKQYYDAKTKSLQPLVDGSTVRVRREKGWDSVAQVVKKAKTPRSYIIEDEEGRILRRNRRDLMCTDERFESNSGDDETETLELSKPGDSQAPIAFSTLPTPNQILPYETRSGRTIRPPAWLQDYEY